MTKVQSRQEVASIDELVAEIGCCEEFPGEIDRGHHGNTFWVKVDTTYGARIFTIMVFKGDTVDSVVNRLMDQISDLYDYEGEIADRDYRNYEHASVTQGRAFDSLTC